MKRFICGLVKQPSKLLQNKQVSSQSPNMQVGSQPTYECALIGEFACTLPSTVFDEEENCLFNESDFKLIIDEMWIRKLTRAHHRRIISTKSNQTMLLYGLKSATAWQRFIYSQLNKVRKENTRKKVILNFFNPQNKMAGCISTYWLSIWLCNPSLR